jgi:hypothetical protein
MAIGTVEIGVPVNLTASGQVAGGSAMTNMANPLGDTARPGAILGFYVNSTSSGTLVLRNGTSGSAPAIGGTITPAIGWNYYPVVCANGIYATIGATLDVTFIVVE